MADSLGGMAAYFEIVSILTSDGVVDRGGVAVTKESGLLHGAQFCRILAILSTIGYCPY